MIEVTRRVHCALFISASSSTVHVFLVVANTCTKPVQKQLVECDTKSKYPKEYSTADNVESEKAFGV